ncbi:hypothetical protein FA13DRAFT_1802298 [Coprinellus micaceus]|uniref:Uncharacterized protein n=1 Tax=Coprinellus micaceus TaxID=71717 RepID=A0A4Y7SCK0_COPMI|nr:hypothetical protein FA13DRAFT_1802298 [Coprinellus micaceus]
MPRRKKIPKQPGWYESPLILQEYRLAHMGIDLSRMPFKQAAEAFGVPELCHAILMNTDVYTIIAASRTNKDTRKAAQKAFRTLLEATVKPFIFHDQFPGFLKTMKETGLGLMGSLLRMLLMSNSALQIDAARGGITRFIRPDDLNVVVPFGALSKTRDYFSKIGYTHFHSLVPWGTYKHAVTHVIGAFRPARLGERTCHVTITESVGNIMHVVLAGPMTCWMNVLTASKVYCAYPTLITNSTTLRTDIRTVDFPRRIGGCYNTKVDNSEWTGKCGRHCPAMPRNSIGDKALASFGWNAGLATPDSRFPGEDSVLSSSIIQWRLSEKCYNERCPNYVGRRPPL